VLFRWLAGPANKQNIPEACILKVHIVINILGTWYYARKEGLQSKQCHAYDTLITSVMDYRFLIHHRSYI